jgi:hypothetical protein
MVLPAPLVLPPLLQWRGGDCVAQPFRQDRRMRHELALFLRCLALQLFAPERGRR